MAIVKPTELPRPVGLIEVNWVLDIGPGLRPMGWYKPLSHVCVEPHGPYADKLSEAGYDVCRLDALTALGGFEPGEFDAIYMLDVIEHLERQAGEEVLGRIHELRPKQIVISTPDGFLAQEGDAWGLGGEYWQRHRSGWTPDDFPGWKISRYDNGAVDGGFTAVWTND
jgi:predicted SAM-dependent methyltransferase